MLADEHGAVSPAMTLDTRIDFIYLSEQDMIRAGVTDMPACVDTMETMFGLLYHGDYRMAGPNSDSHGAMITFPEHSPFPNMPKPTADRRMMAMPAYLGGDFQTSGCKWYGSNIANREKGLPRSILMLTLNDADTGAPLAYMSANLLSAYRTGAIPGVGARHLARKDSKVIGLAGPGVMGKTTVAAFMAACPQVDTIKIKGRGQKALIASSPGSRRHSHRSSTSSRWRRSKKSCAARTWSATAVRARSATPRNIPWSGASGSSLAHSWQCPPLQHRRRHGTARYSQSRRQHPAVRSLVRRAAKTCTQLRALVGVRFMDMIAEGKLAAAQVEDIGKIIAGDAPGRLNDDEIILMSVGGMPIEDVAWGTVVYRNAIKHGIGVKLNLWDQPVLS